MPAGAPLELPSEPYLALVERVIEHDVVDRLAAYGVTAESSV